MLQGCYSRHTYFFKLHGNSFRGRNSIFPCLEQYKETFLCAQYSFQWWAVLASLEWTEDDRQAINIGEQPPHLTLSFQHDISKPTGPGDYQTCWFEEYCQYCRPRETKELIFP